MAIRKYPPGEPLVPGKGGVLEAESKGNRRRNRMSAGWGMLAILSVLFPLMFACQAAPSLLKPRLEENGQLFLYLQSLGPEADRLTFRLEGIAAARRDGGSVPLTLHVAEISGKPPQRDRLLASGILPPGEYLGISFLVRSASLQGEEGTASLPVSDDNAVTPVTFAVARERAQVISLRFRYRESVPGGIRFTPAFFAEIPGRPATAQIGLATSRRGNTVTLFDKTSGKVFGVVPTGAAPVGMALDPAQLRAFVAVSGDDSVEAIDLLSGYTILKGQLASGDRPEELVLTPDRRFLLSANAGSDTVSVIDSASLLEVRRIRVGSGPQSILVDRLGRRAFAFNTLSSTISVLDLGTLTVAATVSTDSGPLRGDFNRAGNRLYVLHGNSSHLSVFDPATLTLLRREYVGRGGTALKVDARNDRIYLARQGTGEVAIYDPFSFLAVDILRIGQDASHLAIDSETNNLFVVLPNADEVRAFRLVGKAAAARIEVADSPAWVSLMGER